MKTLASLIFAAFIFLGLVALSQWVDLCIRHSISAGIALGVPVSLAVFVIAIFSKK